MGSQVLVTAIYLEVIINLIGLPVSHKEGIFRRTKVE